MKVKEITNYLEEIAPLSFQESYDNSGLIVGDSSMEVSGVLVCLDSVEEIVDEAIQKKCNLIVAHHPIVFGGLKKLNGRNYIERTVIKAIKHDIAIYAIHTNLDNMWNGVNMEIMSRLGVENPVILQPKKDILRKLVTFCPENKVGEVRDEIFKSGGGVIGEYDECSFNVKGTGTFKPSMKSNPYSGEKGRRAFVDEVRVEVIYPSYLEKKIITNMIKVHPYEDVAYDIVSLSNTHPRVGSGMIGELPKELSEVEFLKQIKVKLNTQLIRHTPLLNKQIKKVAVCGGSGSFLLSNAMASGADVFITGDFKYHQFFDAEGQILIADLGHYESEQFTVELIVGYLTKKFPKFAIDKTEINTNPVNYF